MTPTERRRLGDHLAARVQEHWQSRPLVTPRATEPPLAEAERRGMTLAELEVEADLADDVAQAMTPTATWTNATTNEEMNR